MLFLDQLREAWGMARHPAQNTKTARSAKDAIIFFYKATLPLVILGMLALAGESIVKFGSFAFLMILELPFVWLFEPISIIIGAVILQILGKYIFKQFKKDLEITITAVSYTYAAVFAVAAVAVATFAVLMLLWSVVFGPGHAMPLFVVIALAILLAAAVSVWNFAIMTYAVANQQDIPPRKALLVILGELVVLFVIFGVLIGVVVLGALFSLGVFNGAGSLPAICVAYSGYACENLIYSNSTGLLTALISQNNENYWENASVAFIPQGTALSGGIPQVNWSSADYIGNLTSGRLMPWGVMVAPAANSSVVSGAIWAKYTLPGSNQAYYTQIASVSVNTAR